MTPGDEIPDLFDHLDRRRPIESKPGAFGSDSWLRRSLAKALKDCPRSREEIADEMGRLLNEPCSVHMLNRYTAESANDTRISLVRFMAFVRATGAYQLLDEVAAPLGCVVVEGDKAVHAQRGILRAQIESMQRAERELARRGRA